MWYIILCILAKNFSSIGTQGYIKNICEKYILFNTISVDMQKLNSEDFFVREKGSRNLLEKYRPNDVMWAAYYFRPLSEEAKLRIYNITMYWPTKYATIITVDWPLEPDEQYIIRFFQTPEERDNFDPWIHSKLLIPWQFGDPLQ